MKITLSEALTALQAGEGKPFVELFQHGSMTVELYAPVGEDRQQPHSRDEIYVILSGQGTFQNGHIWHPFQPGDLFFVPAGVEHRFLEFSADFRTWVIFYGPEGGERNVQ